MTSVRYAEVSQFVQIKIGAQNFRKSLMLKAVLILARNSELPTSNIQIYESLFQPINSFR